MPVLLRLESFEDHGGPSVTLRLRPNHAPRSMLLGRAEPLIQTVARGMTAISMRLPRLLLLLLLLTLLGRSAKLPRVPRQAAACVTVRGAPAQSQANSDRAERFGFGCTCSRKRYGAHA